MPYIKTQDGTQLFIRDWGEGKPVILIHGWPLSGASWDYQGMKLAEAGHRVVIYDRRGFGRSDQPFSGHDYDNLADDLADVINTLNLSDVSVFGFSMGGGEVARYMSRHEGKGLAKAGLISSVVPYMLQTDDNPNGTPQSVFDSITEGLLSDRAKFYAGFFRDFYGMDDGQEVSQAMLDHTCRLAMQASLKGTLDCAAAFATTDFRTDLPAFRIPTLIVHGTADMTVPIDAAGRAAAEGIAGAELKEYEGAPHGLTVTHKDQLADDMLAFLKR